MDGLTEYLWSNTWTYRVFMVEYMDVPSVHGRTHGLEECLSYMLAAIELRARAGLDLHGRVLALRDVLPGHARAQ